MATTGVNFVNVTGSTAVLNGTTVSTPPFLDNYGPKEALSVSQPTQPKGGSGSLIASDAAVVDRVTFDLSLTSAPITGTPPAVPDCYGIYVGNYAKNGSVLLTLSGSTAQTVDFQLTTTNTPASTSGDTAFATIYSLTLANLGTTDLVISPGSSDPSPMPHMGGTTPTFTLRAGSVHCFQSVAGETITSSACNLTVTPSSGGSLAMSIGGA